jgi:hypothetical protein
MRLASVHCFLTLRSLALDRQLRALKALQYQVSTNTKSHAPVPFPSLDANARTLARFILLVFSSRNRPLALHEHVSGKLKNLSPFPFVSLAQCISSAQNTDRPVLVPAAFWGCCRHYATSDQPCMRIGSRTRRHAIPIPPATTQQRLPTQS